MTTTPSDAAPSRVPHLLDPKARNEHLRLLVDSGSLMAIRVYIWAMRVGALMLALLLIRAFLPANSTAGGIIDATFHAFTWTAGAVLFLMVLPPAYGAWQALRRATDDDTPDWSTVPLHWIDWRRVKDCPHPPEQVRSFYSGAKALNVTRRLAVITALLDAGATLPREVERRQSLAAYDGWYPVLRLVTFGVSFETVLGIGPQMSAASVIELLDRLPDLSAADLTRYWRGGLFRDANTDENPVLRAEGIIRDLTEKNGPLASHFYAMNMSAAEIAAARASGVTGEQLEVLAGLSR